MERSKKIPAGPREKGADRKIYQRGIDIDNQNCVKKTGKHREFAIDSDLFGQLVEELTAKTPDVQEGLFWSSEAIYALQTAAESFVTDEFTSAGRAMKLAKRDTLLPKDLQIIQSLRKAMKGYHIVPGERPEVRGSSMGIHEGEDRTEPEDEK